MAGVILREDRELRGIGVLRFVQNDAEISSRRRRAALDVLRSSSGECDLIWISDKTALDAEVAGRNSVGLRATTQSGGLRHQFRSG